jgi:hypothetical protein
MVTISAATFVYTLLLRRRLNRPRRLEFSVTDVRGFPPFEDPDVTINVAGTDLTEAWVADVRILNSGLSAIDPSEWIQPLTISAGTDTTIVKATMYGVRPRGVVAAASLSGGVVVFDPLLLNAGDLMICRLITNSMPTISVSARVKNLREVKAGKVPYSPGSETDGRMNWIDKLVWIVLAPASLAAFFIVSGLSASENEQPLSAFLIALAGAIFVGVVYPLFTRYLVRRRAAWTRAA